MKRHILIIDNEPYFRHIVAFMLRNAGYKVSTAGTLENASALLAVAQGGKMQPDLLFVDIQMPGICTQQLSDDLKSRNITVPILTVGGFTDKSFVIELLNTGHKEFLENIFADSDMNRTIERSMTKKKNGRKTASASTSQRTSSSTKKIIIKKKVVKP
ncbi:MAG TPA: response regulator [Dissulfurispiraceae bacterium]|nr:response regulator [Dissulfurispiraceae bacterium]